jgi:hypothetical protein
VDAAGAVVIVAIIAAYFGVAGQQRAKTAEATAVANANLAATREAKALNSANLAAKREAEARAEKERADEEAKEADKQRTVADQRAGEAEEERLRADAQAQRALAESMAGHSQLLVHRDHLYDDQSLILVRDAALLGESPSTFTALRTAVDNARLRLVIPSPQRRHLGAVNSVAFSPDGQWIVSGGADGTIRLWRAADLEPQQLLFGHAGWVLSVGFSPDGRQIVSGGSDSTVRVWDVASGQEVAQLAGHDGSVLSVGFSPDGRQIVSGGEDSTVRLWDVASGAEAAQLAGHAGSVWSVDFSPDGRQIVSGGSDSTVRVWGSPQRVLLQAIARISRPAPFLIFDERQRFGIGKEVELPGQEILRPLMAPAWALQSMDEGEALARQGQIDAAIARFQQALTYDPSLDLDPAARANASAPRPIRHGDEVAGTVESGQGVRWLFTG